jgi:Family of unknown function (DUF6263)
MIRRVASLTLAMVVGTAVSASAQVKLEYKYSEGSSSRAKTSTKVEQTLTIAGMDIDTKAVSAVVTSTSVDKRRADGTLPVNQKTESIKTEIELPGGVKINIDSADPDAKIDNPQLAFLGDLYKVMAGATHTFILDNNGKVKLVEGNEKLLAKLEGLDPKAASLIKGPLQTETIQRSFEQSHGNLPDTPVRQGETWERTEVSDLGAGQTLTFKKQYEYLGTVEEGGRTLDKIGVKATSVIYAMDPAADSPAKVEKSDLKIESSEGTILFDRASGEAIKSNDKTRIKGDMTLKIGEMELPSKLDLIFESSTALEPPAKSK